MRSINVFSVSVWLTVICLFLAVTATEAQTISGNLKKWHKVTITFTGVNTCENAVPNPFTDYRLTVTFSKGSKTYTVPGYYAADGSAANSGASCGNKWRVHFTPDETGSWNYAVSFRTGVNIAISGDVNAGTAVSVLNGRTGSFNIQPTNKTGNDFRAKGMLRYAGEHHLQFAETGEYFLKGGANSPENMLAYYEFDQTSDLGGTSTPGLTNGLHQFAQHIQDWKPGNPTWMSGKGKGIIGMLNYLAAQHINSVYFLTYNIDGGDGSDIWMWTSPNERYRFDCSKLDQWETVFSHMDSLGIQMHLVTQERENDQVFGGNSQLNNVRKLYYRELIARFSHHLALQWNIGEENDNTDAERASFAQYIKSLDPYRHPVAVHTQNGNAGTFYDGLLSNPAWLQYFESTSIQGEAIDYNGWTIQLRNETQAAGRKWAICQDEQLPAVNPDGTNFDELRKDALWGNLMGGGSGIEWYFGYQGNFGDVQSEDMRIVEPLWRQTRYALDFFQDHLPFSEMTPKNNLVSGMGNYCLAKEGDVYAVYLKQGAVNPVSLSITRTGSYNIQWFDPKTGGALKTGSVQNIQVVNPGSYSLGQAPYAPQNDWVVLVQATSVSQTICTGDSILIGGTFRKDSGVFEGDTALTYLTVEDCWQECNLEIQKLTLVFEGVSGEIGTLTDGLIINKDTLCRFNIRADACYDAVKSVKFRMNGIHFRTESTAPFALAGDNPAGNYNIWIPSAGTHTLVVTPYSAAGGGGVAGPPFSVTFYVVNGDPNNNIACTIPPVMDCNGNINGTAFFDTCGVCSGGLTGVTPNLCATTPVCSDGNPCTNDVLSNGICTFTPIICSDNSPCTTDQCINGQCIYTPKTCNDNSPCTNDQCVNGYCVFTPKICNDNNTCTTDNCVNGQCQFVALVCNDSNPCTIDNCSGGQCVYTPKNCDDGNACTTDSCNNGICAHTARFCEDNNACTTDNCLPDGQCEHTQLICNDQNSCTDDICENGVCVFPPNSNCNLCENIVCDDANVCTIDTCVNGECLSAPKSCNDANTCTFDMCSYGNCYHFNVSGCGNQCPGLDCNDNNLCTTDYCGSNGRCVNLMMNCADDNPCTTDNCMNGTCVYQNTCGDPCANINCSDGNACTTDDCANGQCSHNEIICNDGNSCTTDRCQSGQCVFTLLNCNDGNTCTTDYCVNGQCVYTPVVCSDGNACTTDNCANGQCVHTLITCNDANSCTTDNCANGLCTHTPVSCNDGNNCTTDYCADGICTHQNTCTNNPCSNINCSDENACTQDTCINGVCNYAALLCDDNDPCTIDIAIDDGSCRHTTTEKEPDYLRVVNTAKSWRKLKIGYDSENFWNPKQDVLAGGNDTLCITLRTTGTVDWENVQFRTLSVNFVVMSNYINDAICTDVWTRICIPLSDFPEPNFQAISYVEFPYCKGAEAFEIHLLKIEFTGGTTPFVWFGDEKTDNVHDGQSGSTSALFGELIQGDVCSFSANKQASGSENIQTEAFRVYPVPFKNMLQIDVEVVTPGSAQIHLINMVGQTIQEQTITCSPGLNHIQMEVNTGLPPGIYYIRFESDAWSKSQKIIKAD